MHGVYVPWTLATGAGGWLCGAGNGLLGLLLGSDGMLCAEHRRGGSRLAEVIERIVIIDILERPYKIENHKTQQHL